MFRSYTSEFEYNLRNKRYISEIIDIFTSEETENTPLESRVFYFIFYLFIFIYLFLVSYEFYEGVFSS